MSAYMKHVYEKAFLPMWDNDTCYESHSEFLRNNLEEIQDFFNDGEKRNIADLLQQMIEVYDEFVETEKEVGFEQGFRFGCRLMMEAVDSRGR